MAKQEGADTSAGRGRQQTDAGSAEGSRRGESRVSRGTEQEQQVPRSREVGRRGTGVARRHSPQLPSLFSAPPGLLTGAFMSDPFGFMRRMSEEMNQIFESGGFGGAVGKVGGSGQMGVTGWMPQVEVRQRDNELVVRADLPGLEPDDVQVEVENNVLTLSGERRQEEEDEGEGYFRSERSYGSFYRAIPLPEGVKEDDVKATFDRGVLEVRVPMPEEQQRRGRRIQINRQ